MNGRRSLFAILAAFALLAVGCEFIEEDTEITFSARLDNRTAFPASVRICDEEKTAAAHAISADITVCADVPYETSVARVPVYVKADDGVYLERLIVSIRDGDRVSIVVAYDVFTGTYTFSSEAF